MDLTLLQNDPAEFRNRLFIDTDSGARPFSEIADDWQIRDFVVLDAGWQRAIGQPVDMPQDAQFSRAWLERPRGHSKTLDLGIAAAWALFASRRRLSGIGAAGDLDQARLLRDAISRLLHVNPWLASILDVQAYRVINTRTESTLEIITSDAPTSYGLTPDFIIADEAVHWGKRDLWDSLLSSAAKRKSCMMVSITNAGFQDSWQAVLREKIRQDSKWFFSRLDGPQASWIDADTLSEQERLLPKPAFERLWLNIWSAGSGDALDQADIEAAVNPHLQPGDLADGDFAIAGLDLGVKNDHSALVVVSGNQDGRLRLIHAESWKPDPATGQVDLMQIETAVLDAHARFNLQAVAYDPFQGILMAQRLELAGLRMHEMTFTGKNLNLMASTLLDVFRSRRIELYDCRALISDLSRLRIEERNYGFRLSATRDESGHCDLGTALAIALPLAIDWLELWTPNQPYEPRLIDPGYCGYFQEFFGTSSGNFY